MASVLFDTFAPVTEGQVGTAPMIFVGTTDEDSSAVLASGAIADKYAAGIVKVNDVVFINYDVDGTPGRGMYLVTATGGGSLVLINPSAGGLLAANNLSDVADAATSRTNLGLAIGTDVQAFNAALASIAGLTTSANQMIYTTGANTYATSTLSAFARTVLDDANGGAMLTTQGVKRGITAAYAGGGTSNAFTATGLAATDIVCASLVSSSNPASLTTVVATTNTLTVGFSADPGAATTVAWIAVPAP